MSKHTPGPWVAKRHVGYLETDWRIKPAHPIKGSTAGFAPHAVVKGDARIVSDAEKKANALLIAAAPDLLAFAHRIEFRIAALSHVGIPLDYDMQAMRGEAREVIAKAEGR